MIKTRATLQAATNAINGMTIRLIDLAVMVFARRPESSANRNYTVVSSAVVFDTARPSQLRRRTEYRTVGGII